LPTPLYLAFAALPCRYRCIRVVCGLVAIKGLRLIGFCSYTDSDLSVILYKQIQTYQKGTTMEFPLVKISTLAGEDFQFFADDYSAEPLLGTQFAKSEDAGCITLQVTDYGELYHMVLVNFL